MPCFATAAKRRAGAGGAADPHTPKLAKLVALAEDLRVHEDPDIAFQRVELHPRFGLFRGGGMW